MKGDSVALASIDRVERITDTVYEHLRDAIFRNDIGPGERLSVPALAQALGVSRSPVREAVVRLIQDRLAREEPHRGAVVARVGLEDLASLYEVREMLEGLAAKLAAQQQLPSLTDALETILGAHKEAIEASDIAAHMEADARFHETIREASGNHELVRMLSGIATQVRLGMITTTVTAGPRNALADHRAILDAIVARDAERAEIVARAHIRRLHDTLVAQIVDRGSVQA